MQIDDKQIIEKLVNGEMGARVAAEIMQEQHDERLAIF